MNRDYKIKDRMKAPFLGERKYSLKKKTGFLKSEIIAYINYSIINTQTVFIDYYESQTPYSGGLIMQLFIQKMKKEGFSRLEAECVETAVGIAEKFGFEKNSIEEGHPEWVEIFGNEGIPVYMNLSKE
jgi:hypothetical protein